MYVTVQLCVRKSHERVGVRGRFLKLQVMLTDSEAHFTTSHRFSRLMWKNNFPAIPCRKSVPFLFWAIIILFFMSSALVHRSLFNFNLRNHQWSDGVFPLATMESEASGKPSNSLAALVFVLATKGLLICCPSSLNLWAFSWVFICFFYNTSSPIAFVPACQFQKPSLQSYCCSLLQPMAKFLDVH